MRHQRDIYGTAPPALHRHLDTITIAVGLAIGLAGIFAVIYAFRASALIVAIAGWSLLIAGVVRVVDSILRRDTHEPTHGLLTGVVHGVVGGMFLWRPDLTMMSVTMLIGVMFFAGGFGRMFLAFSSRHPAWGWAVGSGVLSIMLGLYVVLTWPISSLWLIGTLVGVELLSTGIALVATGFAMHQVERRFDRTVRSH
jgi:uncharacterized membrane protein HdeD (DUF308 family)